MLIEQVFPRVIGGKATLQERLAVEGRENGLSTEEIRALISIIPLQLLDSDCFLDRLTGVWRYEFGDPYILQNQDLYGTHMWPAVKHLFAVVRCTNDRLTSQKRSRYFDRLADPEKHADTLVEFLPALRLSTDITADFEIRTGVGNRNVDWRISTSTGRTILIDVKKRMGDLLDLMSRIEAGERDPGGTDPAPTHDVSILFQSIEQKYARNDPELQLQGAWIVTDVKQEEGELDVAFNVLDQSKVHFAVLGDWEPGIKLLARQDEDRQFLLSLFREEESDRYHFSRPGR